MQETKEEFFRRMVGTIVTGIKQYGIEVNTVQMPKGTTGDLDGLSITVHDGLDPEEELFVLLHLFGHTVQWNVDQAAHDIGHEVPETVTDDWLRRVYTYEKDASRFGLTLLNECLPEMWNMNEWMSRWFEADWEFLKHFYRTGERAPIFVDWIEPCSPLEPLPIPKFTPHKFESRTAYV